MINPVLPQFEAGKHYKFGKFIPPEKAVDEEVDGESKDAIRQFEVNSNAVEIGSEFVVSDVLGEFPKHPIKLTATNDAKFALAGDVTPELTLQQLSAASGGNSRKYGCWRFTYSNGNTWRVRIEEAENVQDRGESSVVIAHFNDEASHPAIVEKRFGNGRTVFMAFPADEDWTNLPQHGPANVMLHHDTCLYLGDRDKLNSQAVGDPIRDSMDISVYEINANVSPPRSEKRNISAIEPSSADAGADKHWELLFPEMKSAGFYELKLKRQEKDAGKEVVDTRLFAANLDAEEGDLARLNFEKVGKDYFGKDVKIISGPEMVSQTVQGAREEIWRQILYILGGILILEQFLGWFFGRRR